MDWRVENKMRRSLIMELNGFRHNLYHDSQKYRMTLKVLREAKESEVEMGDLLHKYEDYFADIGISVQELL